MKTRAFVVITFLVFSSFGFNQTDTLPTKITFSGNSNDFQTDSSALFATRHFVKVDPLSFLLTGELALYHEFSLREKLATEAAIGPAILLPFIPFANGVMGDDKFRTGTGFVAKAGLRFYLPKLPTFQLAQYKLYMSPVFRLRQYNFRQFSKTFEMMPYKGSLQILDVSVSVGIIWRVGPKMLFDAYLGVAGKSYTNQFAHATYSGGATTGTWVPVTLQGMDSAVICGYKLTWMLQ